MASIKLTAMGTMHGLEAPQEIGALIRQRPWAGGGTTPVLVLSIGRDTVEVWPADPTHLRGLAKKLLVLADEVAAAPWSPEEVKDE